MGGYIADPPAWKDRILHDIPAIVRIHRSRRLTSSHGDHPSFPDPCPHRRQDAAFRVLPDHGFSPFHIFKNQLLHLFITMTVIRTVAQVFDARETIEGAGVRLRRAFGYSEVPRFDPFLMLDDFRIDNPADYLAGFPWHPHRGIETVTYMLDGRVEHGDSMGHAGQVEAGCMQWMTAGSGIIHQEMPKPVNGRMGGFQLWVNLPRSHKWMDPRYQEVEPASIPEVITEQGVTVRVICGAYAGMTGPVQDIVADPAFFDVEMGPNMAFNHRVRDEYTLFVYVIRGAGSFDPRDLQPIRNRQVGLFGNGDEVRVRTGAEPVRFLLLAGKPIGEPVAWYGPIVMNTQEELKQAFQEYRNGTFLRTTR
jgi:redox-sensitive bicupin YhaK (pirin superfamily)